MRIRFTAALAWVLVLLYATGCGISGVFSADPNLNTQSRTVDGLTITLAAPKAPKLLEQARFVITLADAAGTPVDAADVYLELVMPAMPMGTNKPVANAEGNGVYRAEGLFDMTGEWHVTVHATVQGKEHMAAFTATVE